MKVWKLDDCDFVAARNPDEAIAWYKNETGVDVEEWKEADLSAEFWTGETVGDGEKLSFAEAIKRAETAKEGFPQILATDGYYA